MVTLLSISSDGGPSGICCHFPDQSGDYGLLKMEKVGTELHVKLLGNRHVSALPPILGGKDSWDPLGDLTVALKGRVDKDAVALLNGCTTSTPHGDNIAKAISSMGFGVYAYDFTVTPGGEPDTGLSYWKNGNYEGKRNLPARLKEQNVRYPAPDFKR